MTTEIYPIRPFRPTTGADLIWARDEIFEATEILQSNISDIPASETWDGYKFIKDEDAQLNEIDAWIAADDSGDYASAALNSIQFLSSWIFEGQFPRQDGWTLGAIRELHQQWTERLDADDWDWLNNLDIPEDIRDFCDLHGSN
jgi:hypothetical protein